MDSSFLFLKIAGVALLIIYIRYRIHQFENAIIVQHTWEEHIVNYRISTRNFYAILEEMIRQKNLPDVYLKQVALHEDSWPSRKRLYLRATHKSTMYFISAFQMGKDFFISYRMGLRPSFVAVDQKELTFYQNDSEKAFTSSFHKIIIHAVEVITHQYGNRQFDQTDEAGNI